MESRKTFDKTLIEALMILSREIESEDGVANLCIKEAANRLKELSLQVDDELSLCSNRSE
jgi:hypothetical protein